MTTISAFDVSKLHGAGNDYVLADGRTRPDLIRCGDRLSVAVSGRHTGIGSDGFIVLGPSDSASIRMHMWNADGSRGATCGNGLRCLARFAHDLGLGLVQSIESDARVHEVQESRTDDAGRIVALRIGMGEVTVEDQHLDVDNIRVAFGSTGNRHAVGFLEGGVDDPAWRHFDLEEFAARTREGLAPFGGSETNVEVATLDRSVEPTVIHQRTFELGSGETLACGSGATFVAAAALRAGLVLGDVVHIELRGGSLSVHRQGSTFALEGPVAHVFDGRFATDLTL